MGVGVGVEVGVAVGAGVGMAVGAGVGVEVGVAVGAGVGVAWAQAASARSVRARRAVVRKGGAAPSEGRVGVSHMGRQDV